MPYIPTSYCEHLGCKKPRARKSSFCEEHRLSKPVRKRSEGGLIRDAHYADRQWKEQSRLFLASNTVCHGCEEAGESKQATVADHILPLRLAEEISGGAINWRAIPLQPLCEKCHNRSKTPLERRGTIWIAKGGRFLSVAEYVDELKASGVWEQMLKVNSFRML